MKSVEIRILHLKPGTRPAFHRTYVERGLPLLLQWKMDVVAFGPSHHDEDTFYVIRAFESNRQREEMEEAYYASPDWREGPREELMSLIDSYHDIVFELDENAVEQLRHHEK